MFRCMRPSTAAAVKRRLTGQLSGQAPGPCAPVSGCYLKCTSNKAGFVYRTKPSDGRPGDDMLGEAGSQQMPEGQSGVSLKYGIRTTESPTLKYGKRVYRPDTWRQINSVL